ncbi:MAG: zinc metallopeptidase [Lachnospiraceae bacterium]|nr:zinc metallopeptidase [Lachnospiraceae bacterium]
MYFDSTYFLVIIGAVICMIASARVKSTFNKYARVPHHSGMTGRDAALQILHMNGMNDVAVQHVSGNLTDHYDPRTKTVNLSDATYSASSVAAVSVAAHECGHAIQHAQGYVPLTFRSALVPVANLGSMAAWPLIIVGLFIRSSSAMMFINLGIICFSLSVLFQLVTLPVEFNASSRAIRIMENSGMVYEQEAEGTKAVLKAAALTYVASAAASILQLLRLIMIGNRRND